MPTVIPFAPKTTEGGIAAAAVATPPSITVKVSHIQLGDAQYEPDGTEVRLVNPRLTRPIGGGGVVSGTSGQVRVYAQFQAAAGNDFNATEVGFWAGDPDAGGVLMAVYSSASGDNAPYINDSTATILQFAMGIGAFPPGSITILVDPDEAALMYLIGKHETDEDPHPQYLNIERGDERYQPLSGPVVDAELKQIGQFDFTSRSDEIPGSYDPNGFVVNRADYPDLTALVTDNLVPVATEADWFHGGKQGFFTAGDGVNTIRIPRIEEGMMLTASGARFVPGGMFSTNDKSESPAYMGLNRASYRLLIKLHTHSYTPATAPFAANEYGGTGVLPATNATSRLSAVQRLPTESGGDSTSAYFILSEGGELYHLGLNARGSFGSLSGYGEHGRAFPSRVTFPRGTSIRKFSVGETHAVAVDSTGQMWAWGRNDHGQCGNGTTNEIYFPSQVALPEAPTKVLAAGFYSDYFASGALTVSGRLFLWGHNTQGQVGKGSIGGNQLTPSEVPKIAAQPWGDFWVDGLQAFGITDAASGKKLYATGFNSRGQLGIGSTANVGTMTAVVRGIDNAQLAGVKKVITTYDDSDNLTTTAVLLDSGDLYTIGSGNKGRLGNNSTADISKAVKVMVNVADVAATGGSDGSFMALKNDGTVWSWGGNSAGCLGLGDTAQRNLPVQVMSNGTSGAPVLAASIYGTCGGGDSHFWLTDLNGDSWAVGDNRYGCLGVGNAPGTNSAVFLKVVLPERVIAHGHSGHDNNDTHFFYGESGRVYSCGGNGAYQTGTGTLDGLSLTVPQPVLMP